MIKTLLAKGYHSNDTALSIITGIGLLLFALHTDWLTLSNAEGETSLFLPAIGLIILFYPILYLWKQDRLTDFGLRIIYVPLLIIAISALLRTWLSWGSESIAETLLIIVMFCCYLIGRQLGPKIFYAFVPFIFLQTAYVVLDAVSWNPGYKTGGWLSDISYSASAGLIGIMTICAIMAHRNWPYRLSVVSLLVIGMQGVFFTGSPQGVLIILALLIAIVLRRDFSRYSILLLLIVVMMAGWLFTDDGQQQFKRTAQVTGDAIGGKLDQNIYRGEDNETVVEGWGRGRFDAYERALKETRPLGHEYDIYRYESKTGNIIVHNVPLCIWDQIGPLAALSWLWVMAYCFFTYKWKYVIIVFAVASLFDHYVWTTFGLYWWAMIGVVSSWDIKNDYIFKE